MKDNIYDLLNNADIDLAAYDDQPLDELELERMKKRMFNKKKPTKKVITVAAAASLCAVTLIGTAFASGLFGKAVDSINLGHIEYEKTGGAPSPAEIKEALQNLDPSVIFKGDDDPANVVVEKDIEKLNSYLCFTVNIPAYLPEGYGFDRAEFYPGEDGEVKDSKYITLYFTNEQGEEIFLQERFADEETGYGSGAEDLQAVDLNGVPAALSDGHSLDWENNGLLYSLIAHDIDTEELLNIAKSM